MKQRLLLVLSGIFLTWNFVNAQCPPPGYPPTGDLCAVAPVLCTDLDGYCATLGTNNINQTFPGCGGNVLNNDEWFGFIAGTSFIQIEVIPSNCQGTNGQFGMQGAIYEGSCGGTPVATQCNCVQTTFLMSYGNFIPGQAYYVVFDGCAGDICDFQVNVLAGSTLPVPPQPPSAIFGPTQVCPGANSAYTLPIPNGATYTWTVSPASMGSITSANPGGSANIVWNNTGTAQICVTASNPCEVNPTPTCITVTSANIPAQHQYYNVCIGDCVPCAGTLFCGPTSAAGTPVNLPNWQGCDSTIICHITSIPPITTNLGQVTFCAPHTYVVCGQSYFDSGFVNETCDNWQGCDSMVIVDLAILNPQVTIDPPAVLGCGSNATVTLSALNSTYALVPNGVTSFAWTGPGIVGPSNQVTVTVNQPGQYCLTLTHSRGGVSCTDTKCVTVTQNNAVPQMPQIAGNQSPCQGSTVQYTVTPVGTPAPTGYTWTTPNGETVTQVNPTTVSINWNNATGGQLCVTANNGCGSSAPACIPITVTATPVQPMPAGPATVCGNSTTQTYTIGTAQPGITYAWTVPAGASFTGSGASINVNFSGASQGTGQVCVTATNACGNSQGCVSVMITSAPTTPVLNGPTSACTSSTPPTFSVGSPQTGVTYNWTAPAGATVNGTGPSVTINFNGSSTGQVCVSATNSCGTSTQACQTVTVVQAPSGTISGSGQFCQGTTPNLPLTITLTGTGPWDVGYSINNGPSTVINIPTSPHTLTATQAGTYTLTSVNTASGCTGTFSGSAVITQNPEPTAVLSGSGSICQGSGQPAPLTITLTGTSPWTVNWTVNNNPQAPLVINSSPYTLNIGQAQAGNIALTGVTGGNNCTGQASGTATVTVNTAPTVSMINTDCDPTNTTYTVSFTINGGDPTSYSVSPNTGTLTGNVFTSNPIPSGSGYNFDVTDANGCAVVNVSDNSVICDCTTQAGEMDQTPITECGDGPVTGIYDDTNQVFDGNDVLVYILHSGSGTNVVPPIHSTSTTPDVSFIPATMTYGVTYYLSAVVGDDNGSGGVDLTDGCLSVAQGTPVTFYEIPTAVLSGNPAICTGNPATLTVNFTGEGPWSITYSDGTTPQTVNGITNNPYSLVVSPTASTNYSLTAMGDVNCTGTATGSASVTVNTAVQTSNLLVECNATSTAYTVSLTITGGDPSSYTVTGAPGTISNGVFTSDPIPTGTGFSLVVDDANSCGPKTVAQSIVVCDCTTESGDMSLTAITECGDGPVTATDPTGTVLDADDILVFYLHTGASNTLGTVISTNSSPTFSFDPGTMTYGTTYYISAVAGTDDGSGSIDLMDPCLSIAPGTPVVFHEIPTATISGGTEICPGESTDLTIELTGDSPWSVLINGQQITGIVGTPYTYTVTPDTTTVYDLTQVNDEFCSAPVSESQTVTVHQPPTVANVDVTCNPTGTAYTVCFDIVGGDPAGYQVTPANGTITGNQFCSDEIPEGQGYLFSVTDGHGCTPVVVEDPLVDCDCLTLAGDMDASAPLSICGNAMTMPTYLGGEVLDANDVLCYILHNGNGVPIVMNSSGQFTFSAATMTYGQQYFISAVAGNDNGSGCVAMNDPCLSIGAGVPVTFHAVPTAQLSGGGSICAGETATLTVTLTGQGPWTFQYNNAAGNPVTVNATSSPHTITVSPPATNVYTLTNLMGANCAGTVSGNAIVTVNTPPTALGESADCDPTNTTYTVSFQLAGGDPASYSVTPSGTLTGSNFTSNPITSGTPYSFQVDDANGCGPVIVDGLIVCDCTTDAGMMGSNALISVCQGQSANAQPSTGFVLDANDVLVYVLHTNSGNTLGTVLATSNTPTFNFIPGVTSYNIQYFISAVVGNNNGSGGVVTTDPCLDVAAGTPVIFRPLPTISVSGTTSICAGETATIIFTITGSGPFNVTYTLNGVTQTVPVPVAGTIPVDLSPMQTTTLTLVSIEDTGVGCTNTASQSATITVNQPVSAGTSTGDLKFCANTSQTVNLNNQLTGANTGGVWAGPQGSVPGGNVNIASLAPGIYPYSYTVTGTPPCPDDEEFVTIEIAPVPVADAGQDQELNCDISSVNLGGSGTTPGVTYSWAGGNVSDTSAAAPTTTEPGTYTLIVSNAAGCSSSDVVVISQSITTPDPHISISDVSCFGRQDGFIVIDSITDGDPPYLCSFDGSAFTSQKQFTNLAPGDHTLIIMDASGCETEVIFSVGEPQEVTVEIEGSFEGNDPVIDLGNELTLTIITTPPYSQLDTVVWSTGGLDSCATCPSITVMPTDQTTFSVMVDKDGCRDTDKLTVFVEKNRPVYIPNAFSPNDDGYNDYFTVFGGASVAKVRSFLVFNRWGETMFEYYNFLPNDPAIGWDGRHKGDFMNPGVFTWFAEIEFIDGSVEIYEGDVSLLR
jgi:gliding motility-associated-like protein